MGYDTIHKFKMEEKLGYLLHKVPCEIFFDQKQQSSSCVECLMHLYQYGKKKTDDIKVAPKILYERIFAPWKEYRDDTEMIEKGMFITPQRDGTCVVSCIKALLRMHMKESAYKEFDLQCKKTVHEQYLNSPNNNPLLLEAGRKNLALSLLKAEKRCVTYDTASCAHLRQYTPEPIAFKEKQRKDEKKFLTLLPPSQQCSVPIPDKTTTPPLEDSTPLLFPEAHFCIDPIIGDNALDAIVPLLTIFSLCDRQTLPMDYEKQYLQAHSIERFAFHMQLSQKAWQNPSSFDRMYDIFCLYCEYVQGNPCGAFPHEWTTLFSLYFALFCMFPNCPITVDNSDTKAFRQQMQCVIPSTTFYKTQDNELFDIIYESDSPVLKQFNTLKELFSHWEVEGTGINIFQNFHTKDVSDNDPELNFYRCYRDMLAYAPTNSQYSWDYQFTQQNIGQEQIAILACSSSQQPWQWGCPSFYKLREAYWRLLDITQDTGRPQRNYLSKHSTFWLCDTYKYYSSFVTTYSSQYGYCKTFPPSLAFSMEQKSLRTKSGNYQDRSIAEIVPLEKRQSNIGHFKVPKEEGIFLSMVASMSTERSLQFTHLPILFRQHLPYLKRKEYRDLFCTQIFKTTPPGHHTLRQELHENPALIDLFIKLAENITTFASEEGGDPDIEMDLFSIFILQEVHALSPKNNMLTHKLSEYKEQMNRWIERLSQETQDCDKQRLLYLIHLHRLHRYATQSSLIVNDEALCEIFSSYFVIHSFTDSTHSYAFLKKRMISLSPPFCPAKGKMCKTLR